MLPPPGDSKKEKLRDIVFSLHWAATTGNVGLVKFALDQGVPIDSVMNGFVTLHLACINDNNITVVQYLLDRGANVNIQKWSKKHSVDKSQAVQGATGCTPLHVACANGCIRIVDLLIRNNARVDVKDKYGSTPLDLAHAKKEVEMIKLLQIAKENQEKPRKSLDKPFTKTHKRSYSDKQPNTRRPSLPSIDENNRLHTIHSVVNMTPSSPFTTVNKLDEVDASARRSFSAHRPSFEDMHVHSCPNTPRSSSDLSMRLKPSRASEDSTTLPRSSINGKSDRSSADHVDWYGHGVISSYDDDNYLLSLERRAYNLPSDEKGQLERRSQELRRVSDNQITHKRCLSTGSYNDMYKSGDSVDGHEVGLVDDEDTSSESLPRPSISLDSDQDISPFYTQQDSPESKKNWFVELGKDVSQSVECITRKSLDLRPNLENLTQFTKRGNTADDISDDTNKQQRFSFFSKWTPAWSRR